MTPAARHSWWLAVLTAALTPTLAQGQVGDSVRLQGQVVEAESVEPIAFVEITILDRELRRLGHLQTDKDGNFSVSVSGKKEGVYLLAERIGYEDNRTPFLWFDRHNFFELEIRLDRDAVLLAPLEVVARSRGASQVLQNFQARKDRGMGHYITREEIDRVSPSLVTDLLAEIPGVRLQSSGAGLRRVVQMSRRSVLRCPTQVYIDGIRINTDFGPPETRVVAIDDYVSPGSVAGIEVYRGLSTVPAEFLNEYAECGVVAIWTRRGTSTP